MNLKTSLLTALIILIAVCACGCTERESVVTGEEAEQMIVHVDPIAENLLAGFNEGNYTKYTRDFSPEMKQTVDKAEFEQNREFIISRIGLYESKRDPVVTEAGDFITVNYKATFEREDGVAVRFVFKDYESNLIQGLWFDSPMLRR